MADSDGEYVEDMSDDEFGGGRGTTATDSNYGTRSKGGRDAKGKGDARKAKGGGGGGGGGRKAAWELDSHWSKRSRNCITVRSKSEAMAWVKAVNSL